MAIAALAACAPLPGQVDYSTATLKGTVFDPQNLLVAGASVTVENPSTGFVKTMETAGDGNFLFPALHPGSYRLKVHAKGFAGANATVPVTGT